MTVVPRLAARYAARGDHCWWFTARRFDGKKTIEFSFSMTDRDAQLMQSRSFLRQEGRFPFFVDLTNTDIIGCRHESHA